MRSTRSLGPLLGILTLAAGVACGGGDSASEGSAESGTAAPAAAQSPKPAQPEIDFGDDPSIEGMEIVKGELPKGYPSDLPSYPDATPIMSMLVPGKGGLVGFASPAADRDVFDYYKAQFEEQGWTVESTGDRPLSITSSKGERKASVKIARTGEQTEILITLSGS